MSPHLLRAIRDGEFRAEDFSDSTVHEAIRDGLIEWSARRNTFELTTQGEAELEDFDCEREDPMAYDRMVDK